MKESTLVISRALWRFIGYMAFNRIRAVHGERLPIHGAVLYVATHRNGALDSAVFYTLLPRAVGMVSVQLQRNWLGRLLFPGFPVAREKDRGRDMEGNNAGALDACVAHLAEGGKVLVFPEGTSSLGPRHLPFQKGAARIARAALAQDIPLTVIPLALHYEAPTEWQSRVELLVGPPVELPDGEGASHVARLHRALTEALEAVGVNVEDEHTYDRVARFARIATLGSTASFATALKCFETTRSEVLEAVASAFDAEAEQLPPRLHQGVPSMPLQGVLREALRWVAWTPVVVVAAVCNLPVVAAASWASRALPDEPNVVSFWRMMVGVPAGLAWAAAIGAVLIAAGNFAWWPAYLAMSLAGVRGYYGWRNSGVALWNQIRHPGLCLRFHALRRLAADTYRGWQR